MAQCRFLSVIKVITRSRSGTKIATFLHGPHGSPPTPSSKSSNGRPGRADTSPYAMQLGPMFVGVMLRRKQPSPAFGEALVRWSSSMSSTYPHLLPRQVNPPPLLFFFFFSLTRLVFIRYWMLLVWTLVVDTGIQHVVLLHRRYSSKQTQATRLRWPRLHFHIAYTKSSDS